jgi:hypothetical protein
MTFPFSDDFETYIVDGKFVNQVSTTVPEWTTWSNAPGGDEDPIVSNAYASSGTKSIKISKDNDLILKIGDLTEGTYSVTFNMYIPDGAIGYYNMLQAFSGGTGKWAYEIKYIDGTATVKGPTNENNTFTYNFGTWFEMKTIIDLDNDWCEIFIDNNLVYEFKWSVGTSNSNLKQLAAIDFYGFDNNGSGTAEYYFDDILLKEVTLPAPPVDVAAIVENDDDVVLTWTAPDVAPDAYIVFRKDSLVGIINNGSELTFTDTGLIAGEYYYIVRSYSLDNGYSKPADTVSVTIEGTSVTFEKSDNILLYPNPVKNTFYLKGVTSADRIEIRNITGKLIYSGNDISIFRNGYNTTNLTSGVYTVIIYNKNNTKLLRFVK